MALQLTTQALQLAAGQHSLAVLPAQVVLLLHQLALLLLQQLHLLLRVPMLLQLRMGNLSKCPVALFLRDPCPLPTPLSTAQWTPCGYFTHFSDNSKGKDTEMGTRDKQGCRGCRPQLLCALTPETKFARLSTLGTLMPYEETPYHPLYSTDTHHSHLLLRDSASFLSSK